jgi:NADH dehydrogenase
VAAPIRHILADQENTTVHLRRARPASTLRAARWCWMAARNRLRPADRRHRRGQQLFRPRRWAAHAPSLKTLEDAYEIRRRVLLAFERAERETDAAKRAAWLTSS